MIFAAFMSREWTAVLVNHFWQSTLIAGIAWLLVIDHVEQPLAN